MKFFFKISDLLIYIMIIFAILLPFMGNRNSNDKTSKIMVIINRQTVATLNRQIDSTYQFDGFSLEVKESKTRIISSSCPDHLCEKSGWLDSLSNERIICLPNKIIIKNMINQNDNFDEITR